MTAQKRTCLERVLAFLGGNKMKLYENTNTRTRKLKAIYCNKCKKEIEIVGGILQEDVYQGEKEWGYFSDKDGQIDGFDLCETCYDELISQFQIPVVSKRKKELLD